MKANRILGIFLNAGYLALTASLLADDLRLVIIDPPGGTFTNSVEVTIGSRVGDSVTRYTLNGTDPSSSALEYRGPLTFTSSVNLRAAAFTNGVRASEVVAADFTLIQFHPTITMHPQTLTVKQGENASFTVEATGTPALSFQWKFNGTDIAGATSKDLILTNIQPAEAGTYFVVVSDLGGSVTSAGAVLEVDDGRTGGTIAFGNRCIDCEPDPYVTDVDGSRLSGTAFLAQLYAGTTAEGLAAVGAALPFRTGAAAGYWRTVTRVIPFVKPGDLVYMQVRVWASTNGPSYEAARAAFGKRGGSNVFLVHSGGVPDPMTGMPSFPTLLTRWGQLQSFKLRIGPAIAPNLSPTVRWDQNGLHLTLTGETITSYWIDASEDLTGWSPLASQFTWTGTLEFIDVNAAVFSRRFYRARLVE